MTTLELLSRLDEVRSRGTGKWSARCPFHQDRSPSLSIEENEDRSLLHCFALCETRDIVAAIGLTMADLFFNSPTTHGHRPTQKPVKIDLVAIAFQYELVALDRRLRAERVKQAIGNLPVSELSDSDRARIKAALARAHADLERAELFGCVVDDLRWKEFMQRKGTVSHAA